MDLDAQIQVLVDNAPQDGTTPQVLATIAPVLKALAQQLRHAEYYILQNLAQEWIATILSNRLSPEQEKRVIYAFPSVEDARASASAPFDPNAIAVALPVIHILFQLLALEKIDSLIFFEISGNRENGIEVKRVDFQQLLQNHLQQNFQPSNPNIPPDIA
jgi:hypothetical protein